jgi:SOS response regulatory protein OraA/RecX
MATYEEGLATALRWLKNRDYFQEELRKRLLTKDFPAETVDAVLQFLTSRRLLDDQRTIEELMARNSGKKAIGKEKLHALLISRGAPEDIVASALNADEEANLDAVLRGKFPPEAPRVRAARFLLSRGFDPVAVESAMDRYLVSSGDAE